jgi:hypothetical protein
MYMRVSGRRGLRVFRWRLGILAFDNGVDNCCRFILGFDNGVDN